MLKCMPRNMIYKRLGVSLGENMGGFLSPCSVTCVQLGCSSGRAHVCILPLSLDWELKFSQKQILDSFSNTAFCHPWMAAHKSNFDSISSFSNISRLVWPNNGPLSTLCRAWVLGLEEGGGCQDWGTSASTQLAQGGTGALSGNKAGHSWKSVFPSGGPWCREGEQMPLSQLTEMVVVGKSSWNFPKCWVNSQDSAYRWREWSSHRPVFSYTFLMVDLE